MNKILKKSLIILSVMVGSIFFAIQVNNKNTSANTKDNQSKVPILIDNKDPNKYGIVQKYFHNKKQLVFDIKVKPNMKVTASDDYSGNKYKIKHLKNNHYKLILYNPTKKDGRQSSGNITINAKEPDYKTSHAFILGVTDESLKLAEAKNKSFQFGNNVIKTVNTNLNHQAELINISNDIHTFQFTINEDKYNKAKDNLIIKAALATSQKFHIDYDNIQIKITNSLKDKHGEEIGYPLVESYTFKTKDTQNIDVNTINQDELMKLVIKHTTYPQNIK